MTNERVSNDLPREERMVVLERDESGRPTIWCDPEIADLVGALNKGGVRTVASCSGHGHRPGSIALADGRWLVVAKDDAEHDQIEAVFPTDINGDPTAQSLRSAREAEPGDLEARIFNVLVHDYPAPYTKVEALAKKLARLHPSPSTEGLGVMVKALPWSKRGDDWYAETEVGQYAVGVVHGSFIVMLRGITNGNMHDLRLEDQPFDTPEAAQAAAHADYERRILSALTPVQVEPVPWPNGCNATVPDALRFLASNDRPSGGEQRFNSAHLHQLASEIERMASRPLYASPPSPSPVEVTNWQRMFFWPDAKRRLWWLSQTLATTGKFNRADLCNAFGMSIPQASSDIQKWIELHPGAVVYDKSAKCYVPALNPGKEGGE